MTLGKDNGTDGQTGRQTDRQSATQYNNNNNNNTSIYKAHNISIRAESEAPSRPHKFLFDVIKEQTVAICHFYGYCHSLDDATLFSKVDSNKLRIF